MHIFLDPQVEKYCRSSTRKFISFDLLIDESNNCESCIFTKSLETQAFRRLFQVSDGHFVQFFAPSNLSPLPKNIVFVIDVSGSMWGVKMKQVSAQCLPGWMFCALWTLKPVLLTFHSSFMNQRHRVVTLENNNELK